MIIACGPGSKLLTGEQLAKGDSSFETPEGRVIIEIFNDDNGTFYCVPTMSERELVEFKLSLPLLMVQNVFAELDDVSAGALRDKPLQESLRLALKKKFPCGK